VRQVINFTDGGRSHHRRVAEGRHALRDASQWIEAFLADAAALGLEDVEERPRATDRRISRRWRN
jgi:hypothetical protein